MSKYLSIAYVIFQLLYFSIIAKLDLVKTKPEEQSYIERVLSKMELCIAFISFDLNEVTT